MNKKLKKIFNEDQKDRNDVSLRNDVVRLGERDKKRKKEVLGMIRNSLSSFTGLDYYHAAMIFQHGHSITDSRLAVSFSKKAMKLNFKKAKSLYAVAIDRYLIKQGKKQKFGTQYRKENSGSPWELLPIDGTVTDEERLFYDVKPLDELKKRIEELNNKK